MLKSITLRNFQKHEFKRIKLAPITCLVGPTERGKSAVIRALRLIAHGVPSGGKFIRWGANKATVSIIVDGEKVSRIRGKKTNEYKIGGETYKAFGGGKVPQPVIDLLNIGPDNIQSQHDNFFWLFDSPPKIAKSLNRIANLEQIDAATQNIALRLRRKSTELSVIEERLEKLVAEKGELEWASECEGEFAALETAYRSYKKISRKTRFLASLLERVNKGREGEKRARIEANAIKTLSVAMKRAIRARERAEGLRKAIKRGDRLLKSTRETIDPDAGELHRIRAVGDGVAEDRGTLESIMRDMGKLASELKRNSQELAKEEKLLHKLKAGICPVCGK